MIFFAQISYFLFVIAKQLIAKKTETYFMILSAKHTHCFGLHRSWFTQFCQINDLNWAAPLQLWTITFCFWIWNCILTQKCDKRLKIILSSSAGHINILFKQIHHTYVFSFSYVWSFFAKWLPKIPQEKTLFQPYFSQVGGFGEGKMLCCLISKLRQPNDVKANLWQKRRQFF